MCSGSMVRTCDSLPLLARKRLLKNIMPRIESPARDLQVRTKRDVLTFIRRLPLGGLPLRRFAFRDVFRQCFRASLPVPFLERVVRDLPLNQQLGELAPLGLALEWHRLRCYRPGPALSLPAAIVAR